MQTNGSDEDIPILHLLPIIQKTLHLTDACKEFDLTKSQVIVMIVLHCRTSITMSEAAQYMSSSKEHATRVVSGLCSQGLVERYELPENRTHVFIRLTQSGMEFMKRFKAYLHTNIYTKLESSLSTEEISTLMSSLQIAFSLLNKVV